MVGIGSEMFSNDSNRLNIGDEIPNIITLEVDIHA